MTFTLSFLAINVVSKFFCVYWPTLEQVYFTAANDGLPTTLFTFHDACLGALFYLHRSVNLTGYLQAQRDYFGSHTYQIVDGDESWHHNVWSASNSADSITTSTYNA
jgi:6-phosphogluconate dehydrogenase